MAQDSKSKHQDFSDAGLRKKMHTILNGLLSRLYKELAIIIEDGVQADEARQTG